jgi:hypothetical protein
MIDEIVFSTKAYFPSAQTLAQLCDITGMSLLEMLHFFKMDGVKKDE